MRGRALLAAAAALALAACSALTGGDGADDVGEAHLVSDRGTLVIAGPIPLRRGITLSQGETLPLQIRLFGANGVRLAPGAADSAAIRFSNPAVATWEATGDLAGTIVAGERGQARLYVDAYRDGVVVFTSGHQPMVVR